MNAVPVRGSELTAPLPSRNRFGDANPAGGTVVSHGKPLTLSVLAHQAVVSCTVDTAAIKVRYRLAIVGTKTMGEMVVMLGLVHLGTGSIAIVTP